MIGHIEDGSRDMGWLLLVDRAGKGIISFVRRRNPPGAELYYHHYYFDEVGCLFIYPPMRLLLVMKARARL